MSRRFTPTEHKRRAIDKLWKSYATTLRRAFANGQRDSFESEILRAFIEETIVAAHDGNDLPPPNADDFPH